MTENQRPPAINSLFACDATLDEDRGTVTLVMHFRTPFDALRLVAALKPQETAPARVVLHINQPCTWTVKEHADA
jgi:hypothetical protein